MSYSSVRDVREWDALPELVTGHPPAGALWPLVGARRSGKTYAIEALRALCPEAQVLKLDAGPRVPLSELVPDAPILLVDEPGRYLFANTRQAATRSTPRIVDHERVADFLAWCQRRKEQGQQILVALSPGEWAALLEVGGQDRLVQDRDRQLHLKPLTQEQARIMAARAEADWALEVLASLPEDWTRSPFLLELALSAAEREHRAGRLAGTAIELVLALARSDATRADYVSQVLYDGLSPNQQDGLRKVSRGERLEVSEQEMLEDLGLITVAGGKPRICDPLLHEHLPAPLRLHHVSDVHFGKKSAGVVDAKDPSQTGRVLARDAGPGVVADAYAAHVADLAGQGRAPHLLVVSGDLAEWALPEEYSLAVAWLERVESSLADHADLRTADPRVLLVGGNHDVSRGNADGPSGARDRHRPFSDAFSRHPRPRLEEDPTTRTLAVVFYPQAEVEVVLLGSSERGQELNADIDHALAGLHSAAIAAWDAGEIERAEKLRKELGRIDPGLVHHEELSRVRRHGWRAALRIAVLHHPISPLPTEVEIAPYAGLLNAGLVKQALLEAGVSLVLHGHAHRAFLAVERWPGRHDGRTLTILGAPTLGSRETYEHHGYNEVLIFREGTELHFEVRVVRREGESWRGDEAGLGSQRLNHAVG